MVGNSFYDMRLDRIILPTGSLPPPPSAQSSRGNVPSFTVSYLNSPPSSTTKSHEMRKVNNCSEAKRVRKCVLGENRNTGNMFIRVHGASPKTGQIWYGFLFELIGNERHLAGDWALRREGRQGTKTIEFMFPLLSFRLIFFFSSSSSNEAPMRDTCVRYINLVDAHG